MSVACLVDADGDGVFSDVDTDDTNPNVCADADGDSCDDCAVTGANGSGGAPATTAPIPMGTVSVMLATRMMTMMA